MQTKTWNDCWSTLAHNWRAITQGEFTITVSISDVCQFMSTSSLRDTFEQSVHLCLMDKNHQFGLCQSRHWQLLGSS